ncbi:MULTISPECIES: hypothetical protein [unclassified Nocardia]|uniref:hypothetical protein n=1 Tax=unclassified Nocardia TaxID=2637762 RepID=UPI001CE49FF2|nr:MULTISPECIES: hypothetical protein [unclassified Nocardia]
MKIYALRAIPVLGWLYLAGGVAAAATGNAPESRVLRAVFWIDAFLSVVVHAAQVPAALRAAQGSGRPPARTVLLTQIFGMTWWAEHDDTSLALGFRRAQQALMRYRGRFASAVSVASGKGA